MDRRYGVRLRVGRRWGGGRAVLRVRCRCAVVVCCAVSEQSPTVAHTLINGLCAGAANTARISAIFAQVFLCSFADG